MNNRAAQQAPDYGIAKLLRGFPNFEDYYQGQTRGTPIALGQSPATMGRDAQAQANYGTLSAQLAKQTGGAGPSADGNVDGATSPNLLEGIPVTLGANVIFAFPRPLDDNLGFTYKIIWRLRTADIYAQTRIPYHSVLRGFRYTDKEITTGDGWNPSGDSTFAGQAAQRAVIATFEETIRYTQTPGTGEPAQYLGQQTALDLGLTPEPSSAFTTTFVGEPSGTAQLAPILPFVGGNAQNNVTTGKQFVYGEYGQNPLVGAGSSGTDIGRLLALAVRNGTSHVTYSTVAKGDEAIVLVYRSNLDNTTPGDYDFDSPSDFPLSAFFGRGGYQGLDEGTGTPRILFPTGTSFGAYLIQGFG